MPTLARSEKNENAAPIGSPATAAAGAAGASSSESEEELEEVMGAVVEV